MRGIGPGDPANYRQALGYAIKFHREERGRSTREVSRRTRASISDVEAWERGALVPSGEQWAALRQGVNRALNQYSDIYRNAREEELAERQVITKGIEMHSNGAKNNGAKPLTTSLGDKLATVAIPTPVTATPAPDARTVNPGQAVTYVETASPQPTRPLDHKTATAQLGLTPRGYSRDGRTLIPLRPPNSMSRESIDERIAYARGILLQRPAINLHGDDGILALLRSRFGIGLDPDRISKLRKEIETERIEAGVRAKIQRAETAARDLIAGIDMPSSATHHGAPPLGTRIPQPTPVAPAPTGEINEADISAAVDLVLGAIPNLQQFSISVDEHGEASVDYQIREVKVTTRGGGFKVKR